MKKYLVLIVLSLFTFTSCKDKDDDFVKDPDLVGRWYMYSSEQFGIVTLIPHCKDKKTHLEFKDNGVLKEVQYNVVGCKYVKTENMKYTLNKDIVSFVMKGGELEVPHKYKVDGDKMILTTLEEKSKYRVTYIYKRME